MRDDASAADFEDGNTSLGKCCLCANDAKVIICLPRRAPMPGKGWGCVVCNLPMDGAISVLCKLCFEAWKVDPDGWATVISVCVGYPGDGGRMFLSDLPEIPFAHDKMVDHG